MRARGEANIAFGLALAMKAPPSRRTSKVAPTSDVNENDADVEFVGLSGRDVMVVSGAVVSIVQVKLAGVASVLPARSVARTSKVCEPAARPA